MSYVHQILPPKPHVFLICLTRTIFSHQNLICLSLMSHAQHILPPEPHMPISYVSRAPHSPTKTSYAYLLCLTSTIVSHQNLICLSLMSHAHHILPPKPHMPISYVSRSPYSPTKTSYVFLLCFTRTIFSTKTSYAYLSCLTRTIFSHQNLICLSLMSHAHHILPLNLIILSLSPTCTTFPVKHIFVWFDDSSTTFRGMQTRKLFMM
jgi:hypothetical protein